MNTNVVPQHSMDVMDQSGHFTITWDPNDETLTREAREKFQELLSQGYHAFRMNVVSENGVVVEKKDSRMTTFDPQAGRIMMLPHLVGG